MRHLFIPAILVTLLIVLSCGDDKRTNAFQDVLVGSWLYDSTNCLLYYRLASDIAGRELIFESNGSGTLYYFYNEYAKSTDAQSIMIAEFNWKADALKITCKFQNINKDSTAIELLDRFSDEYSGYYSIIDSTFNLYDGDPNNSCYSCWHRMSVTQ